MPHIARTHQLSQSLLYHIYNRGNFHGQIFHDDEDYRHFIKLLSRYSNNRGFQIYHWVLMSNHYHLIIEIAEPEELSSIMSGLARSYVYYHNTKYTTSGHLWQGRFKSQPIQKELYLLACGRYIERNPVKADIVGNAEEYNYSSAAYYVTGRGDGLATEDPLFITFSEDINMRREKYREFLKTFDSEEEELFETLEYPRGSKEFLSRLVKEKGLFLPRRRGRPIKN